MQQRLDEPWRGRAGRVELLEGKTKVAGTEIAISTIVISVPTFVFCDSSSIDHPMTSAMIPFKLLKPRVCHLCAHHPH